MVVWVIVAHYSSRCGCTSSEGGGSSLRGGIAPHPAQQIYHAVLILPQFHWRMVKIWGAGVSVLASVVVTGRKTGATRTSTLAVTGRTTTRWLVQRGAETPARARDRSEILFALLAIKPFVQVRGQNCASD